MVKDKTQIIIPPIHIRKSRELPIIIAIIFIGLFIWQCNSTGDLRNQNKALEETNKELIHSKTVIDDKVRLDSLLIVRKQVTIDSLTAIEQKHLRQLYNVNKKYEKLKIDYSSATSDDKWELFTRAINN
jgi:hypothetical protein